MKKTLLIIGCGGHGKVIADTAHELGTYASCVFVDDRYPEIKEVLGHKVIGKASDVLKTKITADEFVVAIGNNETRLSFQESLEKQGNKAAILIHPRAVVTSRAQIGAGTVIFAGAVVNVDSKIGKACILNTGSTIDHECEIGNGVHISPGANIGGQVSLGEKTWIGIGASVKNNIKVGTGSIVGAGAAVVSDVASGQTVMGVPAKPKTDR